MRDQLTDLRSQISGEGTVILAAEENPLDLEEWNLLDKLSSPDNLPFKKCEIGDTDESHYLYVGSLMTDVHKPEYVNAPLSHQVLQIIGSDKMMAFYKRLLGARDLYIRRCQVNLIPENGFNGYHIDNEANPDYIAAIVFQFSSDYEGGEYVVHHKTLGKKYYKTTRYTMLISRCDLPHEVQKVTRGERKTLVCFLGSHFGENRRWNKDDQSEKNKITII